MARWMSKNSGWSSFGSGGGSGIPTRLVMGAVAFTLMIGLGLGYVLASSSAGSTTTQTVEGADDESGPIVVPTDYNQLPAVARSQDGAVRAATSFATSTFNLSLLPPADRSKELDRVLSDDVTQETRRQFEAELNEIRAGLLGPVGNERPLTSKVLVMPGSYKAEDISPQGGEPFSRMRVTIWMQAVQVDGARQQAASFWNTSTLELTWSDHWRINTFSRAPGPSPEVVTEDGRFSSYPDVVGVFNQFKSYRYATQQ